MSGRDVPVRIGRAARRPAILFFACGAAVVAAVLAAASLLPSASVASGAGLAAVEASVAATYRHVSHVEPAVVADRLRVAPDGIVLVDVREATEHAVSHLPGALRADPDIAVADFLARHADIFAGRKVVLYCSVGVRSSELATRLAAPLRALGARSVHNMSGGIFRWHNEARSLVDVHGPTGRVHPYDRHWARYLDRSALVVLP